MTRRIRHILTRGRSRLIVAHLRWLQKVSRERPVPLGYWRALRELLRSVFRCPDVLFPPGEALQGGAGSLSASELRELLCQDALGTWALDRVTIDWLWKRLKQDCPRTIVEFGAGVSTLILAKYAATCALHAAAGIKIISIEQELPVKAQIEQRLKQSGFQAHVRVLHAPISELGKYSIDEDQLRNEIGADKVDWLLIDGPAGPEGCRVWTLPLMARFCQPDARWFLDDAFRDGELTALRSWSRQKGLVVHGILPIGKGLATGMVRHPSAIFAV